MDYRYKFRTERTFCKHPVEDCVVRTVPTGPHSYNAYIRFSGEDEYLPFQSSNIVLEVELSAELEFITEDEYYAFGKKRKSELTSLETPERIGGMQSLILDLASGRKQPTNERERRLLQQIKDIDARGGMLDLPFE